MATYATLTVPVLDIIGADFNASRASVWIEPNVPVVIADSIRVGGRREQVVNGVATFANLVTTNSADNPTSFGYRVTITAPPKGAQKREDIVTLTTSDFPFTATANLKDIDEAWDDITAPVSWRSDFLTSVSASASAAAASATSAAASAALAQDLVISDLGTTDGQTRALIEAPASQTAQALSATYVAKFPAPTGSDQRAAMQAALDALGATQGGVLLLQAGTYRLGASLRVPNKVILRGVGRSGTVLQATGAFSAGNPVVHLGPDSICFNSRLEDLTVDAAGTAVAVRCHSGQELTGLSRVVVQNFTQYGVHLLSGCANWNIDGGEFYPAAGGATAGVYADGNSGANELRRCTVGVSGHLDVGVHLNNSSATVFDLHAEKCTDGLLFAGSNGAAVGVTGPTATTDVTNLVRMDGNSRYVTVAAVTKNGATNAVKDEFFGRTVTDPFVQLIVMGDGQIARLRHYGDQIGFFGAAPIGRKAGIAPPSGGATVDAEARAAITAILAALNTSSGYGLIGG